MQTFFFLVNVLSWVGPGKQKLNLGILFTSWTRSLIDRQHIVPATCCRHKP